MQHSYHVDVNATIQERLLIIVKQLNVFKERCMYY